MSHNLVCTLDAISINALNQISNSFVPVQSFNSLSDSVGSLFSNFNDLSDTLNNLRADVTALSTSVDALRSEQNTLSSAVTSLRSDLTSLSSTVAFLRSDYDSLLTTVTALSVKLNVLDSQVVKFSTPTNLNIASGKSTTSLPVVRVATAYQSQVTSHDFAGTNFNDYTCPAVPQVNSSPFFADYQNFVTLDDSLSVTFSPGV